MRDALVLARDCNMDVFNALNVMVRRMRAGAVWLHTVTPRLALE